MWTIALQFLKRPTILIILALTLAMPVLYLKGRGDGKEVERLAYLKADNAALIKSTQVIAEAFDRYEPILSDIAAKPDPSKSPALITSTIKRLPEPKSKKK